MNGKYDVLHESIFKTKRANELRQKEQNFNISIPVERRQTRVLIISDIYCITGVQ
jgi:hypothetical protein